MINKRIIIPLGSWIDDDADTNVDECVTVQWQQQPRNQQNANADTEFLMNFGQYQSNELHFAPGKLSIESKRKTMLPSVRKAKNWIYENGAPRVDSYHDDHDDDHSEQHFQIKQK